METSDILTLIVIVATAIGGAIGIGIRWANIKNKQKEATEKQDETGEKLKQHKKYCKDEFDLIHTQIDDMDTQRFNRHKHSGDLLNDIAKLIEPVRKQRPRPKSTESDDGA